jgi:hypothetical protein
MSTSTDKPPLSPTRLVAIALMSALSFAAVVVPLHRVLHAPVVVAQRAQSVEQNTRAAEAAPPTPKAVAGQEAGQFALQDDTAHQAGHHPHAGHSPFGHTAGKECDNWNAVFGADSFVTQPLGVIGPDAALTQKITPPRDTQYARLYATQNLARAPPRC